MDTHKINDFCAAHGLDIEEDQLGHAVEGEYIYRRYRLLDPETDTVVGQIIEDSGGLRLYYSGDHGTYL